MKNRGYHHEKKRFTTGILTLILVLSVTLCDMPLRANAMTILDVPTTPSATDYTVLGIYGSYYSQAQEALDKINAIRKEACESGNVPDMLDGVLLWYSEKILDQMSTSPDRFWMELLPLTRIPPQHLRQK